MERTQPYILIVDDDDAICDLASTVLEEEGCRVGVARCLGDAAALVETEEPDVALLDINLPDGDGLTFVARIKSKWPSCQVIMVTAESSVSSAVEAIHQGAVDYISKPFTPLETLWLTVERALARRKVEKNTQVLVGLRRQIHQQMTSILETFDDE